MAVADFIRAVQSRRLPDAAGMVEMSAQLDELVAAAAGVEREPA
jgi:hypothetical protein